MHAPKKTMNSVPSICIEDIPDNFKDKKFWDQLPNNGGNVLSVEKDSDFGKFLLERGFMFKQKSWGWLVVFR